MIRVPFPDDVNDSPLARYKRHSGELSFPCNASEAVAFHRPEIKTAKWPWAIAAILVLASTAMLTGCQPEPATTFQTTQVQSSAQKACPSGHSVEWIDSKTMTCIKEQL